MIVNDTLFYGYYRINGERNYSLGDTEMIRTIMPPVRFVQPNLNVSILLQCLE